MAGEDGSPGDDGSRDGDEDGPWPDPGRVGESDPGSEADGDREYRKWDQVSDPPEPGETFGSWSSATRDRLVAGLVFLMFVAYGVYRAETVVASPPTAAAFGLATFVTVNLQLPEVRERIPLLSNPRTALRLSWLIPVALVAHVEAGRAVAFLAFVVVMSVAMTVGRRLIR